MCRGKTRTALKSVLRGNFFEISRIANVICKADKLEKYDKYGFIVFICLFLIPFLTNNAWRRKRRDYSVDSVDSGKIQIFFPRGGKNTLVRGW